MRGQRIIGIPEKLLASEPRVLVLKEFLFSDANEELAESACIRL